MIGDESIDRCRRRRRAPGTCRRSSSPPTAPRGIVGRIEQRDERAVVDREQRVHGDERVAHRDVTRRVGLGPVGDVLDLDDHLDEDARGVGPVGADAHDRVDRLAPPAHAARRSRRVGGAQLLDRVGSGEVPRDGPFDVGEREQRGCRRGRSRARPLRPTARSARRRRRARRPRRSLLRRRRASIVRRCTCRHRTRTVSARVGAGIDDALGPASSSAPSRRPRRTRAARARRTASASGSSAPTRGTGRARSPRRAPRRRRRARRRSGRWSTSRALLPGFLEEPLDHLIPRGQPACGLEAR